MHVYIFIDTTVSNTAYWETEVHTELNMPVRR